jgi:hypothetical protein
MDDFERGVVEPGFCFAPNVTLGIELLNQKLKIEQTLDEKQ